MISKTNILSHSIFGEYNGIENRVTAALLHIIQHSGDQLLRYLLAAANELLPDNEIRIETQVGYIDGKKSIFDGVISCDYRFKYIIESKVVRNALSNEQVEKYHDTFDDDTRLLAITPDNQAPKSLFDGDLWLNWTTVVDVLRDFNDENQNELLQYLIGQFELMLTNLKVYDDWKNRVIIVGGSYGEPVALKYGFYACQNNRFFKKAAYLAFAHHNHIKNLFRIVGGPDNNVNLRGNVPNEFFNEFEPRYNGELRQLFKLEIVDNNINIENDNVDKNGRRCAFVQRQTYTTIELIKKAKKTSEL